MHIFDKKAHFCTAAIFGYQLAKKQKNVYRIGKNVHVK